jgi:16S rRNA (uracil1498-N3)-methyltransferase
MKRLWRVYYPASPAEPGAEIELPTDESHYVRRVLRLGAGGKLSLFDGRGGEWAAEIVDATAGGVRLVLTEEVDHAVEPAIRIEIFQGLCRADRMELVIQKATELGVAAVHPLSAERADLPGASARKLQRWSKIAVEACRQSGRRVVPEISVVEELPPPTGSGVLAILLQPSAGAAPLADLLSAAPCPEVWLAVGPESGFSRAEIDLATSAGWRPGGLGPRVLRTESAGLAAVAIVLSLWGDLGSRSG